MQEPDFKVFSWLDEVFPLCLQKTYAREREREREALSVFGMNGFKWFCAGSRLEPPGTPASDTE